MPRTDENGNEWFDLFDKADLELFNRSVDALGEADEPEEPEEPEPEVLPPATRARALDMRAADVTPGHEELHHYWTRGEGRAKWVGSPKPWTTLVGLLTRHVGLERAKTFASRWFHEVFGFYAGSDLNRVTHGHPPRGDRIGPG